MAALTRRQLLTGSAAAAAVVAGAGGCEHGAPGGAAGAAAPREIPVLRLLGDGSTADTGPQPKQPVPRRLEPGERPPQFVVFSWDGAGEDDRRLFSHFRQVAAQTGATMTFFLSGVYLLPRSRKELYRPPGKPVGACALGYFDEQHVRATIEQLRLAWLDGHEIGTHFNGHFCDPQGVGTWTPAQWLDEIEQAVGFVHHWRTNTGMTDPRPLPFDYASELIGGRTPCLLGQDRLLPAAARLGWKYDASSPGDLQLWPVRKLGLWDFPLQLVPFPGHSFEVLSMDYNMFYNQSRAVNGTPSLRPRWQQEATAAYLAGFERAYTTNRAPFFIGNHFESWNGGIYMAAVEEALRTIARYPDVRLVSFRQLVRWLEVQDPGVLRRLRTLFPGQKPADWAQYTTPDTAGAPA